MKKALAAMAALVVSAGCSPSKGTSGSNPIDDVMAPIFVTDGITPVEADKTELCHRLSADLLGRYLTAPEMKSECKGSVDDIVRRFQGKPEYLVVSERNWRDRFDTSDVNVDWRLLKDLYGKVDDMQRGRMKYSDFAIQAMSHPGLIMNVFQPEDRVTLVFNAFMGRTPTAAERADVAALYRPWLPNGDPADPRTQDPDFPYIYRVREFVLPYLCDPISNCTSSLFGGGVLDLSSIQDPTYQGVMWEDLSEAQKDALREPGRVLTRQDFFWEAAADEILSRYLGWSDGGRFPREPGIVLPGVREALTEYLKKTDDYPAAERIVLTSWLYRMKAQVPDDGLGDDPGAPVPKIYATGPVKPVLAETWLDSTKALTIDLGACDARYSDSFPFFLILQAQQQGYVSAQQATLDLKKLWTLEENRMPWNDTQGTPDFTYQYVARLIGGCPGFQDKRQPQTGLNYAFTQESLAELICDAGVAQNLVPPNGSTALGDILTHQMELTYGRDPTDQDKADYAAAAASCSGADCTPAGEENSVCVGLLGGAEMIFY